MRQEKNRPNIPPINPLSYPISRNPEHVNAVTQTKSARPSSSIVLDVANNGVQICGDFDCLDREGGTKYIYLGSDEQIPLKKVAVLDKFRQTPASPEMRRWEVKWGQGASMK